MRVDAIGSSSAGSRPWGLTHSEAAAADMEAAPAANRSVITQAASRGQLAAVADFFAQVFRLRARDGAGEPKEPSNALEPSDAAASRALQVALSVAVRNKQTPAVWFLVRRLRAELPVDETAAAAITAAVADGDTVLAAIKAAAVAAAAAAAQQAGAAAAAPSITVVHVDDDATPAEDGHVGDDALPAERRGHSNGDGLRQGQGRGDSSKIKRSMLRNQMAVLQGKKLRHQKEVPAEDLDELVSLFE
jgi:hypothetical protein